MQIIDILGTLFFFVVTLSLYLVVEKRKLCGISHNFINSLV